MTEKNEETYQDFKDLVNMGPAAIEKWLDNDHSKEVGQTKAGSRESQGRKSARKIIKIKRKKKADLTAKDFGHMRKVISYNIKRHLKQRPKKDVKTSDWRYSLKNWGHDPVY